MFSAVVVRLHLFLRLHRHLLGLAERGTFIDLGMIIDHGKGLTVEEDEEVRKMRGFGGGGGGGGGDDDGGGG